MWDRWEKGESLYSIARLFDRHYPSIARSENSYIATLVARHSRYVMLAKIKHKDAETIVSALIKQSKKLPDELYKSLTWDRGTEMLGHQLFTLATNIDVYFCDTRSPWQRG